MMAGEETEQARAGELAEKVDSASVVPPLFRDRFGAGRVLGRALLDEADREPVVAGLARGGVQTAAEVARALDAPLDVVAVRKIGHPLQPEYALGALTPGDGNVYVRSQEGLSDDELAAVVARTRAQAEELDERLHAERPPLDLHGRAVILVDDGLATGATMVAAVRWARNAGAARVVAAVPVAAADSARGLREEVDRLVCPYQPEWFLAVGVWYEEFGQVSDEEVVRLLDEANTRRAGRPATPARGASEPDER